MAGVISLSVANAFTMSGGDAVKMVLDNESYQVANDLTLVRGNHQIAVGGNVAYWTSETQNFARAVGDFNFNGTGDGLGAGGLHDRAVDAVASFWTRSPAPAPDLPGAVWPGHLAPDPTRDGERGSSLGALFRPADREWVHHEFQLRQLPSGHQDQPVRQRAGGAALPGGSRLPARSVGHEEAMDATCRHGSGWPGM